MTFTNVTALGIYMQCCHREVEPGGSFSLPWETARTNRAVRAAMADGSLAWVSGPDEPQVPGSPKLPDPKAAERRRQAKARQAAEDAARVKKAKAEADAGVKANMAAMGRFKVPTVTEVGKKPDAIVREKPITQADVIKDAPPTSLAAIRRHNRAVKTVQGAKSA